MEQLNRKTPRLKEYDYASPGYYFVTICAYNRREMFSRIIDNGQVDYADNRLTAVGRIAAVEMENIANRYPEVYVDKYVIMPNHVHAIIVIQSEKNQVPLTTIVGTYKSLVSVQCMKIFKMGKVFQTSFHEHVIRSEEDYQMIWQYIDSNPVKWREDRFYSPDLAIPFSTNCQ